MAKIGWLLPNSTLYPGLGFDMVEGLKAGLTAAGETDVTFVVEGIGFGTDADDLLAKSQKLLMQETVDVVVGMVSRRMLEPLIPLFTAANRLLLVLDIMGDYFGFDTTGPTVFYHSLQACLGSRLAARKAVESGATAIAQAVSFYDAGYLQSYAMAQGVETNGGQMTQYVVSSHIPAQVTLQPLQAVLDAGETLAITALYAGNLAEQFYRLYADLTNLLPLWVSPLMLEEQMLDTLTKAPDRVRGYVAWSEQLETPANTLFMDAMRQRGRRPNLFSVIAYEAATVLGTYLASVGKRGYAVPADFQTLSTFSFEGPRGFIRFDPETHYSFGPHYATALAKTAAGTYRLADLIEEPTVAPDRTQFQTEPRPMSHTGWHNTYLCI